MECIRYFRRSQVVYAGRFSLSLEKRIERNGILTLPIYDILWGNDNFTSNWKLTLVQDAHIAIGMMGKITALNRNSNTQIWRSEFRIGE